MKIQNIPLEETGIFSALFKDYISGNATLKPFYEFSPSLEGIEEKITNYKFTGDRNILMEVLHSQYKGLNISDNIIKNIGLIGDSETYTVTTGHQLNIFSGPLYFIYKIISTINLAKKLKEKFPDKNFIPTYWMATEDHDFEEINNFILFNKTYKWQTDQKGAVGRFSTTEIEKVLKELPEKITLFEKAYSDFNTLADATRYFVNELFGERGLIIIDGDNIESKKLLIPVLKKELFENVSYNLVNEANNDLIKLGYEVQVNPREINCFWLDEGIRERIIKSGNVFKINNTNLEYSEEEMLSLIETNPEMFSPNVLIRPLYQEILLPNLCYIGGPAEISYWLQLKPLFNNLNVPFPVLLPRNFVLYIPNGLSKKMQKLGLDVRDLFLNEKSLKDHTLSRLGANQYVLEESRTEMDSLFHKIAAKAKMIDVTLEPFVLSEKQKTTKILEEIEKRFKKGEEKKNEDVLNQVINLKGKLFPNGSLQERTENFLNFFINDTSFINKIETALDPLNFQFYTIQDIE